MQFKTWLQENLAGPGGGPDLTPIDLEKMNQGIANKGAGAFNTIGNDPPTSGKPSPTDAYQQQSVRPEDQQYAKAYFDSTAKGTREAMVEIINQHLTKGVITCFADMGGFTERDKSKLSAYRALADQMGVEIGAWKLNRSTGVATATIKRK